MDKEKYIYYEVHGYLETDSGEREELNLICTSATIGRAVASSLLTGHLYDSVTFDVVESTEKFVL